MRAIVEEYIETADPALFARMTTEEQRFVERTSGKPKKKRRSRKAPSPEETPEETPEAEESEA